MSGFSFIEERFPCLNYEYHDAYVNIINRENGRKSFIQKNLCIICAKGQDRESGTPAADGYVFRFETQHFEISGKTALFQCIEDYTLEKTASIEFYDNGQDRFGGEIDTSLLAGRFRQTAAALNGMTFVIKSWNGSYDASGKIQKIDGKYTIV